MLKKFAIVFASAFTVAFLGKKIHQKVSHS